MIFLIRGLNFSSFGLRVWFELQNLYLFTWNHKNSSEFLGLLGAKWCTEGPGAHRVQLC
jgi:hypothetical protein